MVHSDPELTCTLAVHSAELLRTSEGVASRDTRLAVARSLARIYADVLREPLPPVLVELLNRLEAREAVRR